MVLAHWTMQRHVHLVIDDSASVRTTVHKVSAASRSETNGVAQVAGLIHNMKTVNRRSATTLESTARAAARRLLELSSVY